MQYSLTIIFFTEQSFQSRKQLQKLYIGVNKVMKLKGLLKIALVLLAVSSLFVACDTIAGGKWPRVEKVYMKPSEDWADGRFAVWFWETGKEGSFTDMKASTEYEGLYEVNVPAGVDNVIFVKMSADSKENSWDNKEAQTGDLQVPILGDGGQFIQSQQNNG